MIILQIIATLFLIPFTMLLLVLFNIYVINWLYFALMTIVGIIYASVFGLLFNSVIAGVCIFIILTMLYVNRMRYLAEQCNQVKNKDLTLIRACIKCIGIKLILLFPLSFLKILKRFPACWSKKLLMKTGLNIEFSSLIDLILNRSKGTQIEIHSHNVHLNFEIL